MNTLDQQLQDLCDIHGLTSISITAYNAPHGKFFGVNAGTEGALGSALGQDRGITELFAAAVLDLRAKQGRSFSQFVPLEIVAAHEAGRHDADPFYERNVQ